MTIEPGQTTGGSYKATHPYMRNNFKGTEEIQATMEKIYEVRDEIRNR